MTEPLIVYSRQDCHLCELVMQQLDRLGIPWRPVDVDADPELEQRYGLKVPVLFQPAKSRELYFPFDDSEVQKFVDQ